MAARFWIGAAGNYNSTNWSLTSGGAGGQAAPTSSDDVTFDGAGANGNTNCTITATAAALTLTFTTGYTATITINATFTLTVSGSITDRTNHTWTVNSTNAGALTIDATSTITSNGKTFPGNVTFSGSNTKTLSGDWTITGGLTLATTTTTVNKTTAEVLNCAGLTTSGTSAGTITLSITGGIWTGSSSNTISRLTLAGNVTLSGTCAYNGAQLDYTSGTITTTGTTLNLGGTTTLNTNPVAWNNVTVISTSTFTNNSLFIVSGTFTMSGAAATWAGTTGFQVANYSDINTSARTITLANTVTYTITTSFNCFKSTFSSIVLFTSDHATNKAILNLRQGAVCNVLASFTRIDSSGGRPIITFNGTLTTCINIVVQTDVQVPPPMFSRRYGRGFTIYDRANTVVYERPRS